ncbi:PREDICTED: uncharacterized protein LOC109462223 [Branchiostoma belcheri]|uniref:Uncharacterized protein LOC109462223 n=1 Tax=Branchiostoma belcheri TaxID=7741 RepID=A0A6P4XUK8_BRABE|nr:PREDICTED: uncharacterized protein LOC109462223 [Branchiostoma belcheri]
MWVQCCVHHILPAGTGHAAAMEHLYHCKYGCDLPHQPLLGKHRSFTSSRRRTHPHPPRQPMSTSPVLRHPFPVPVELWAGARNVHAATLGQDGAHDGQRAPSLPFLIRGSRPLMDLTRQPPIHLARDVLPRSLSLLLLH